MAVKVGGCNMMLLWLFSIIKKICFMRTGCCAATRWKFFHSVIKRKLKTWSIKWHCARWKPSSINLREGFWKQKRQLAVFHQSTTPGEDTPNSWTISVNPYERTVQLFPRSPQSSAVCTNKIWPVTDTYIFLMITFKWKYSILACKNEGK